MHIFGIIIYSINKHLRMAEVHIHSSQYNYILHGLLDVTLQSTRDQVILHCLREVTSERQVILHDPSVTSMVLMV